MSASYPSSAANDAKLSVAVNSLQTTLSVALDLTTTSVVMASSTGFPATGYVTIDTEVVQYTGISVNTLTGCTRAADGTAASTHATGSLVSAAIVANHHNSLRLEIEAIEPDLIAAQEGQGTVAANMILKAPKASPVFTGTPVLQNINGTFIGLGRNRILNRDMDFDQVKEGSAYTVTTSAHYTLDQWRAEATGTPNYTVQRSTDTHTGLGYSMKLTTNTSGAPGASDASNMEYVVEGPYMSDFFYGTASAVTGTLSFWARASIVGNYSIAFLNQGANYSYVSTYTINVADTWELKTITVPGPTAGTWVINPGSFGLKIVWDTGSGSGVTTSTLNSWQSASYWKATGSVSLTANAAATLYIDEVQWEIGASRTTFERLPYPLELNLLRRYIYKTFPQGTACVAGGGIAGAVGYVVQLPGLTSGGSVLASLPIEMNPQGSAALTFYNPIVPASAVWYNATQSLVSGTPAITLIDSRTSLVIRNPQVAGDAGGDVLYIHFLLQSQVGGA